MLFNSFAFLLFLPIAFAVYWLISCPCEAGAASPRRLFLQNLFVVGASYVFYGWWSWKFLLLISLTSCWAWGSGLLIGDRATAESEGRRFDKLVVALALVVNLGILAAFKYHGFFIDNTVSILRGLGMDVRPISLQIMLPVGISFYTFQALGYVIDVYRGAVRPTRDLVAFLAFVSFFPQLVAGPIERAKNLLPQFLSVRRFDYGLAAEGCRQMLWGFFKKVIVADACAGAAETTLGNPYASGIYIWVGMVFFAFQIYGDFSGYSDIAIGCSKLFGIRLSRNFKTPYFSRDIAEFWRRWHISLTTWFRDYLYIPMGGSRCSTGKIVRNTFVVFLVSGFWHGSSWCFVLWGAYHAVCFLPLMLFGWNRRHVSDTVADGRVLPSARELLQMAGTFIVVLVGWVFFRAPDVGIAFDWFMRMFGLQSSLPIVATANMAATELLPAGVVAAATRDVGVSVCGIWAEKSLTLLLPIMILLGVEWFNRMREIPRFPRRKWLRWTVYLVFVVWLISKYDNPSEFIYFQF